MTPGAFRGEPYDGVMRDIDFNHVTTCKAGRCGDDVFVHDSKPKEEEFKMPKTVLSRKAAVLKGAVSAYLMPKLAMDAKGATVAVDIEPILSKITAGNFKANKAQLVSGITAATKGKLANDAKLDDLPAFLGAFDADEPKEAEDEEEDDKADDEESDDDKAKKAQDEFLKGKLSAEDKKAFDALCGKDSADEDGKDKAAKDDAPALKPEGVSKPAMDAAIAKTAKETEARVTANFRSIRAAETALQPYVGALSMAFDSAADVYKHALEAMEVDVTGVDPSAFPALLKMVPVPGSQPKRREALAMDAAGADSFATMYPDAKRIGNA